MRDIEAAATTLSDVQIWENKTSTKSTRIWILMILLLL